ncbi:MAG: class I tRNA ligase family protein, partial [Erysipelotrichaceae bacterium]
MVKKVTSDIDTLNLNTAISQMMIFINDCYKATSIYQDYLVNFIKLFAVFAPHVGEELWFKMGYTDTITYAEWPTYDEAKLVKSELEIAVQVNGKLRATITVAIDESDDIVKALALKHDNVIKAVGTNQIRKVIVIRNKIVNIVI